MEENIQTDPYIYSWTTAEGFEKLFYRMRGENPYKSQEFAYEAAERNYKAQFKVRRYASWESFKNTKNSKLKKRQLTCLHK